MTSDEKQVLDAYRRAKRDRLMLHVVPQAASAAIYTYRQEAKVTTMVVRVPVAKQGDKVVDSS